MMYQVMSCLDDFTPDEKCDWSIGWQVLISRQHDHGSGAGVVDLAPQNFIHGGVMMTVLQNVNYEVK